LDFLLDPLGSVIGKTSSSGVEDLSAYFPYGERTYGARPVSDLWAFVGWLGYRRFDDTLYDVWNRWYETNAGHWKSLDALWPDELAYMYVAGMPAMTVDWKGLQKSPTGVALMPSKKYSIPSRAGYHHQRRRFNPPPPLTIQDVLGAIKEFGESAGIVYVGGLECLACIRETQSLEARDRSQRLAAFQFLLGKQAYPRWYHQSDPYALGHCVTACMLWRKCPKCYHAWNCREVRMGPDERQDFWNNSLGVVAAGASGSCFDNCVNLWNMIWFR